MSFTERQVLDELRKNGVTTMEELARRISEESKAKDESRRGMAEPEEDYIWSGKNYSIYHPE
jgi:hypothetical protein